MKPTFDNLEKALEEVSDSLALSMLSVGLRSNSEIYNSLETIKIEEPLQTKYEILLNFYWFWLDKGRGPTKQGPTPGKLKDIILQWISKNNIVAKADENGKTPTKEQLAFLITRKINRDGFPARNFTDKAIEAFNQKIDLAFKLDYEVNLNNIFK